MSRTCHQTKKTRAAMARDIGLSMSDVDRRPLHSFPTRRSSDLPTPLRPGGGTVRRDGGGRPRADVPLPRGARSEEHTSELQSHVNRVCRLLLSEIINDGCRLHYGGRGTDFVEVSGPDSCAQGPM